MFCLCENFSNQKMMVYFLQHNHFKDLRQNKSGWLASSSTHSGALKIERGIRNCQLLYALWTLTCHRIPCVYLPIVQFSKFQKMQSFIEHLSSKNVMRLLISAHIFVRLRVFKIMTKTTILRFKKAFAYFTICFMTLWYFEYLKSKLEKEKIF